MSAPQSTSLEKLLSGARLAALPTSALQIMELSKNPEVGVIQLAAPIEADPGLTSQVLRFVNSSYFGFVRQIPSVRVAIQRVGVRSIKNFALWSAVFSMMPNPQCGPFDLRRLWHDSVRRGLFGRSIARLLGHRDGEEAFAAALLQDMAVPLLASQLPNEYAELLEARHHGQQRLSDLETAKFGWHHGQAGAAMARQWSLPSTLATLIEQHTGAESASSANVTDALIVAVRLSSLLPASGDARWFDVERFENAYQSLSLATAPELADLLATVDKEFEGFAGVLNVNAGGKSLLAFYQEAVAAATE